MSTTPDYLETNASLAVQAYVEVVMAHDAVHPDRNVCGGVGGCVLMMAEHEASEKVRDFLDSLAHIGGDFSISVVRR
jgi:galactokinase